MQLDDLNRALTAVAAFTLVGVHSVILKINKLPSLKITRWAYD